MSAPSTSSTSSTSSAPTASPVTPQRQRDTGAVVRRLVSYMAGGPARLPFIATSVLAVVGIVGLVATPYAVGQAINVISEDGSAADLRRWSLTALGAVALYVACTIITSRSYARLATNALYGLQTDLIGHLQGLSLSFYDRQSVGNLMSRVTNDTEAVAQFYESAIAQLVRSGFQILAVSALMFAIEWRLTLASLLVVPLMLLSTVIVARISNPAFARLQEKLGDLGGFQEETVTGHKVIIANRRHEWASEGHRALSGEVYDVASRAYFTSAMQLPVTIGLVVLQTALVLFIGAVLVISGELTLGTVVAFLGFISLLSGPLSDASNLVTTTLSALAGGRRVFDILDEAPTTVDAPDAVDYRFEGGHVRFEHVDFSYVPGRRILHDNSFEARPGEMVGIVGPTGAGKSTIINILTRYYDLDGGRILIDGQELHRLTQASLRRQIGTVLQETFLFSDTVMNNLLFARPGATPEECVAAAKEANAHEFVERLPDGYDTVLTERGANLSQGQRQMLTIARAMVADPKMLVLDEATSNVDTRTERLIQEGLARLMAGKTSFVIAHRLSTVRDAAKILVVNGGRIAEVGSHDELIERGGLYRTLYLSQFKGRGPAALVGADGDGPGDAGGFVST